MKILLSAASFSSSISGLQRHAFNLAHCLLPRPEVTALHLVVAPWQADLLPEAGLIPCSRLIPHIAEMGHSSLSRNLWHYRRLPELASSVGADIVHLTFPMPIHSAAFRCPTVVTLHDMYPYDIPLNFGFPKCVFNRLTLRQCLRSVDSVSCVSQATNLRLLHHAPGIAARKSVCIYNCVEASTDCATVSPISSSQSKMFLLCVAQHRRNKNIPLLIRAYTRLWHLGRIDPDMTLVIVGMTGPETARIRQLISGTAIATQIHLLEGLSDPELQWCYKHCAALVAPSIIEGFGLPVAEALLAGARVVCSDIPAFREIGGDHCLYVSLDGNAERALADSIVTKLREPAPDPIPLPLFSGPVLARQYIDLYRRLIGAYAVPAKTRKSASLRVTASGGNAL